MKQPRSQEIEEPRREDRDFGAGDVGARSTATADFQTSWSPFCARPGYCAPGCRARSGAGAGARAGVAVRRSGGARRRIGGVVRVDRDDQQPAGRLTCRSPSREEMFGGGPV